MKKLFLILIASLAFSCDANNRSSDREVDPSESDTSSIHNDTTTTGGMNRQNQYDTLK